MNFFKISKFRKCRFAELVEALDPAVEGDAIRSVVFDLSRNACDVFLVHFENPKWPPTFKKSNFLEFSHIHRNPSSEMAQPLYLRRLPPGRENSPTISRFMKISALTVFFFFLKFKF